MFDQLASERPEVASLSARQLVDAVDEWARVVNAAAAMRASLVAELFTRRTGCETAQDRVDWWADPETAVVAELAAALRVTQGLAARETERAVALRDRLPAVAALFAEGLISEMTVRTIVFRTGLINDPDVLTAVDAALAQQVRYFGALSAKKVEQAIDATVIAHDPVAQRRARERAAERTVGFGDPDDVPGMTSMWARLDTVDAVALRDRIDSVAGTVCASDPRGVDERRAAALGVIGAGLDVLPCACGHDDCDAADIERPVRNTTVFVVVDEGTAAEAVIQGNERTAIGGEVDGTTPSAEQRDAPGSSAGPVAAPDSPAKHVDAPIPTVGSGEGSTPPAGRGGTSAAARTDSRREDFADKPAEALVGRERTSEPRSPAAPRGFGVMPGAGVVPTALLGAVLDGARVRRVVHPGDAGPEDRYTPSAALAAFVRCRDMTCRFPFCDAPATDADIDHTVPWPLGPTHASNMKCLCREHHQLAGKRSFATEHGCGSHNGRRSGRNTGSVREVCSSDSFLSG